MACGGIVSPLRGLGSGRYVAWVASQGFAPLAMTGRPFGAPQYPLIWLHAYAEGRVRPSFAAHREPFDPLPLFPVSPSAQRIPFKSNFW
jgi:hypothetical protein